MITLEIWSTFLKVDLGKGLVHALDMGLAPFGQGIPASQSPETWYRSGETYSITVNLSLGLPTLSIMRGRQEKGHLKYRNQAKDPSCLGSRIVLAAIIYVFSAYGKYQCKCRPPLLKIFFQVLILILLYSPK